MHLWTLFQRLEKGTRVAFKGGTGGAFAPPFSFLHPPNFQSWGSWSGFTCTKSFILLHFLNTILGTYIYCTYLLHFVWANQRHRQCFILIRHTARFTWRHYTAQHVITVIVLAKRNKAGKMQSTINQSKHRKGCALTNTYMYMCAVSILRLPKCARYMYATPPHQSLCFQQLSYTVVCQSQCGEGTYVWGPVAVPGWLVYTTVLGNHTLLVDPLLYSTGE